MPPPSSSSSKLLSFHRSEDAPQLTHESVKCIKRLASYHVPSLHYRKSPRSRSAAVLVALFVGRKGDLYVLLSQSRSRRRARTLRTYAGDTSLPGGKVEDEDENIEATARREAFEEIGLSMDRSKVPLLCIMDPFLAGNSLIVTPVVVLVLDQTLRPVLNRGEVESLFSHSLRGFLSSDPPSHQEMLTDEVPYHTYNDIAWVRADKKRIVRMHRFLTGRETGGIKPVFGLTAAILIRVATIGYGRLPDFEVKAPGQLSMEERIDWVLCHEPKFIEAYDDDESRFQSSIMARDSSRKVLPERARRRKIRSKL